MRNISLILSVLAAAAIAFTGCNNKEPVNINQPNEQIQKNDNQAEDKNADIVIKRSKDNKNYCYGGEVSLQLNEKSKKETLYIFREELEAEEYANNPVRIRLKINDSEIVFDSQWNDGVYVSTADFDKADKDLDIYITNTGTDIEAVTNIYKYDGNKIYKYTEFSHFGKDFYYDENGRIYYWYNDETQKLDTCFDYKTKQASSITDKELIQKLNNILTEGKDTKGNLGPVSEEQAREIVNSFIGTLPKGYHIALHDTQEIDGKEYYVFQHYEFVIDNEETGEGHTATSGWYYVEKDTGKLYLMDFAADKLEFIK